MVRKVKHVSRWLDLVWPWVTLVAFWKKEWATWLGAVVTTLVISLVVVSYGLNIALTWLLVVFIAGLINIKVLQGISHYVAVKYWHYTRICRLLWPILTGLFLGLTFGLPVNVWLIIGIHLLILLMVIRIRVRR